MADVLSRLAAHTPWLDPQPDKRLRGSVRREVGRRRGPSDVAVRAWGDGADASASAQRIPTDSAADGDVPLRSPWRFPRTDQADNAVALIAAAPKTGPSEGAICPLPAYPRLRRMSTPTWFAAWIDLDRRARPFASRNKGRVVALEPAEDVYWRVL